MKPKDDTPPRLKTPAKKKPKNNAKSTPAHGRKPSTPKVNKNSPLRSVSNVSDQSTQQGTIQRRPGKGKGKEATPEWRKKLVRGENPGGDQCDLFAPMKLESVFKPPTPGSDDARNEFSFFTKTDSLWTFTDNGSAEHQNTKEGKEDSKMSEGEGSVITKSGPQHREDPDSDVPESPTESVIRGRDARNASPSPSYNYDTSNSDVRLRTVSGREELRNEGITPISLSRPDTVNATSDVIKSALKKLNSQRDKISSIRDRPGSRASDSGLLYQQSGLGDDLLSEDDLLEITSQSLPQDLSMGTLDFAARGAFLNLRRGGYSNNASFQHRHLSPSSFPSQAPTPSTLANSKLRSSPPPYGHEKSIPTLPAVTLRQPSDSDANKSNPSAMKPAGSPLKLFGNHDTFTNNKLLRRMSQFEETFGDISEEDEPASPTERPRPNGSNRSLPNLTSGEQHEQPLPPIPRPRSQDATDPRMNQFGDGQLENAGFPGGLSSPQDLPQEVFEVLQKSPKEQTHSSRGSQQDGPRKSKASGSISERRLSKNRQRMPLQKITAGRRNSIRHELRRHDNSEVKRGLNTPVRDSTPKRRRTLGRANSPPRDYEEELDLVTDTMGGLSLLQKSLIRQGIKHETEAFESEAQQAQQPKTPTPSQKRSSRGQWLASSRGQSNPDLDTGDANSTNKETLPPEVTSAIDENRRGSITTQDFLDEATKIMNIIRAKGRPKSGLAGVEESGMEGQEDGGDSYGEESTREEFSRPPSREGVVMRDLRNYREQNPRVASHLEKFKDKDDLELLMGASVMSLHLDQQHNARLSSKDTGHEQDWDTENGIERSPHNIRIRENPFTQRKRKHSARLADGESNAQNGTTEHTEPSSSSSTGRSVPTGSSNGSNAKGVISSDMISHLIPEQVNGMTYDRSNHTWVRKTTDESIHKQRGDDSEDPFQGIPDLSVDELEELMRVQELSSPEKIKDTKPTERESDGANTQSDSGKPDGKSFEFHQQTRDRAPSTSSVQSTRFTSSGPKTETRATSWETGELPVKPVRRSENEQRSKEAVHEVNLHEGRTSVAPQRQDASARQPRAVTISFSSPVVSHVAYPENSPESNRASPSHSREKSIEPEPIARDFQTATHDEPHPKLQSRLKTSARSPSRRTSLDGRPFIGRSISRIDEQNEESPNGQSLVPQEDSGLASSPDPSQLERSLLYPPSGGHDPSYTFHLSPLPDFTVNQIDDPLQLEVSYIALRTNPTSLRQVHGTFALAVEDLVKHITDAEPYEPYWEHIRRLDLSRKGLITIHRLCDFCPRLEELDVSYNDIGQLSGAPSTLRHLRVQHNCISSLTAWGHLNNLQYLDVSGNDLDNLDGFSGLVHLRELRANNNKIRSLDGILDLDGLLSLKLRGNALTAVDFEGSEL